MSKRNVEGDVLSNRLAVGQAKSQRLLAAMLGPNVKSENADEKLQREKEREDLEDESFGPEQLGFGAPIPKNIKDGTFTRRVLTSDDKLLQALIGKRAAKAHMAAKETTKRNATPINFNKPVQPVKATKPVESDDEDEGRTAAFKSKRQKTKKRQLVPINSDGFDVQENAQEMDLSQRPGSAEVVQDQTKPDNEPTETPNTNPDEDDSGVENTNRVKSRRPTATKGSYLDEILAERSKKKENKQKKKENVIS